MAMFEDTFDGPADVLLSTRPGWTTFGSAKLLFTTGAGGIKCTDTGTTEQSALFARDTEAQNHFIEVTVGKSIEDFGGIIGFVKGGMGMASGTYPYREAYSISWKKEYSTIYLSFNGSNEGSVGGITLLKAEDVVRIEAQMAPNGQSLTVRLFINAVLKATWSGLTGNLTRTGVGVRHTSNAVRDDVFRHVRGGEANFDIVAPVLSGQIVVETRTYNSLTLRCPEGTDNVSVVGYEWSRDAGATWTAGTQNHVYSGLLAGTTYQVRARAKDGAGNPSVALALAATTADAPANLSALTVVSESSSLITASVTAQAAGRAWAMATTSATPPTAEAVKAGTSGAAPGVTANLVAGINAGCFSLTGLQPSTTYWIHATSEVDANNLSPVLTSAAVASRHLGVLGSVIKATTATGANGPGFLYPLVGAQEDGVYFHFIITRQPTLGYLDAQPNGAFEYAGDADSFEYRLFKDGVDQGLATVQLQFSGVPDTTAPTLTGAIEVVSRTHESLTLRCPEGADNVGVVGYEWSRDAGATWTAPTGRDQTFSGLAPESTHAIRVRAKDAAGNVSTPALAAAVTTDPAPVAAVRRCSILLTTDGTTPAANLAGIRWAWWDSATPTFGAAPLLFGANATTNAAGSLEIDLPTTTLGIGGVGTLLAVISDGTPNGAANRALCKPVAVI